jgi:hypothetical protein
LSITGVTFASFKTTIFSADTVLGCAFDQCLAVDRAGGPGVDSAVVSKGNY